MMWWMELAFFDSFMSLKTTYSDKLKEKTTKHGVFNSLVFFLVRIINAQIIKFIIFQQVMIIYIAYGQACLLIPSHLKS